MRCEFYSQQPPNIRRPVTLSSKNTAFSAHFSKSLKKRSRLSAGIDKFSPFRQATNEQLIARFSNVSDSARDLTSRARSSRNASALRWQTISGGRLCPSEHLPHRFCSKRA